jgi:hypothetical protein
MCAVFASRCLVSNAQGQRPHSNEVEWDCEYTPENLEVDGVAANSVDSPGTSIKSSGIYVCDSSKDDYVLDDRNEHGIAWGEAFGGQMVSVCPGC